MLVLAGFTAAVAWRFRKQTDDELVGWALVVLFVVCAFFALVAVYGGMSLTLYSLSLAHVNDQVPAHEMVGASSTLILLNGAGAFVAPILLAVAMGAAGIDIFLPILAALHLLLALYAVYRMTRRAPMPEALKTPYVGTPPGTTSSGELLGYAAEAGEPGQQATR